MIAIALSILILMGLFKLIPLTREFSFDVPLAAVLAPAILNFILGFAMAAFALPEALALVGLALFFIVPLLYVRFMLGEKIKVALIVSAATFVVVMGVQVGLELLLARE